MEQKLKETKHIVAYLDFLGATKKIKECDRQFLNELNAMYDEVNRNCIRINCKNENENLPPIKHQIFSDNIVLAQEIIEEHIIFQVFNFILFIAAYLHKTLLHGFLVRGGITIGNLYIDEKFVFGNALVRSYKLESEIAIYPRVVVDYDIFGILTLLDDEIGKNFSLPVGDDFLFCIDGFRVIYKPKGYKINFEKIKNTILKTCKYEKDLKIVQKHLWVINQFNLFCEANQSIVRIDVDKEYANVEQLVQA